MNARKAYVAAAIVTTFATATGCGTTADRTTAAPEKSAAKEPKQELLDAVPGLTEGAYRFAVKGNVTPISGVLDAPRKSMQMTVSQSEPGVGFTLTMTTLVVDRKTWMKIAFKPADLPGLPRIPKKWLLIDPAKVKNKDNIPLEYGNETDPGYVADIVRNAAEVKRTAPGHFTGTTDLTGSAEAEIVEPATLTALGEKAKAVPFQAVVDDRGHLTSATVRIPAAGKAKAATYQVAYQGFGATEPPAAPAAGAQQKAPAVVYDLLGG